MIQRNNLKNYNNKALTRVGLRLALHILQNSIIWHKKGRGNSEADNIFIDQFFSVLYSSSCAFHLALRKTAFKL